MEHGLLLGVVLVKVEAAGGLAGFQMGGQLLQPCGLGGSTLVVAALCGLGHAARAVLDDFEVGEDELVVDGVDVGDGVHGLGLGHVLHDMDDVVVIEAAHDMDDGIALADVAEELVAEAGTLACALDEAGDVHEFDDRRGELFGMVLVSEPFQPGVGDGDNADVGVDGAESVVIGGNAGVGDGVEEGGLADVRQSDNT